MFNWIRDNVDGIIGAILVLALIIMIELAIFIPFVMLHVKG